MSTNILPLDFKLSASHFLRAINLTSQNLQDGKIGSFVVDTRTNSTGYGRFYDLLAASDAEL